jgi:hypothetical protein
MCLFLLIKAEVPTWLQDTKEPLKITRRENAKKYWKFVGTFVFFGAMFVFFGYRLIL